MAKRVDDWMRQADKDFQHAESSIGQSDFEWACFAAQQAAEKALMAFFLSLHGFFSGHDARDVLASAKEQDNSE
jgi:HEPN domain-containing protein